MQAAAIHAGGLRPHSVLWMLIALPVLRLLVLRLCEAGIPGITSFTAVALPAAAALLSVMFPPWKAAASLLSNRGFMLQAVLIAVLLGVHTAIAAACLPLLGALRFSLLDAADLVVMAAVTYATMRASHAHLPRAIVLAVLGLCFICAYRPGAASEADAAAASPLMDIGSVDAAGVDGGLPPVPELVSRKLTAVAPLPPRVPRTRADANAQRDANADVDADADADALPSQVVQHEEDAQVPVPAPILQPSLAPAMPGVDAASKLQPIAKRGRRAAALAAARGVRNALRGTSWFSVALAASLLVFATWLSGVRRRLVRSLAAASKSHTMHISALAAIIASVLWLPLALVRVMWGDGSAAGSPTVGGEDAMSAGAAMNAEVSSLRVLLAAVLFGAVVLGFTDVARDAPILQTGGISGATSGAAALHSHSTGASAVARNAAMKAVDSFLIRLILCASPMLLALVLPSLFGPTLLHSSELTIALWLGAFLCYLPALPLLAGVNVEWLLSRMARSLQSAAAAADSQGRASAPHRLLAYLFAALHAALMHLANVMRAAGLTGVPGEVSVGGMAGGGGAGMGGLLPLTLADGKALFSGFASGGGGDAASSLAGAHGSRASQLLGCNPVTVRRIIRHIMEDSSSRRIAAFLAINFSFMFVEVFVGWMTNSLGLLSDAGHMFFDNASLVIGLYASYMARWQPDSYFPYGYARYETLAGLVNAIFLVFVAVSVVAEGLERLWEPPAISGAQLLPVAIAGLCVNGIGLIFFHDAAHGHSHGGGGGAHGHSHGGAAAAEEAEEEEEEEGHGHSHGSSGSCSSGHHGHAHGNGASKKESSGGGEANENMYGVYLHVLADALGSVGVIISSILIEWKGWHAADPIASLIISLLILASVVPLARGTIVPLLQGMPAGKEGRIRRALDEITRLPGVSAITQPHFWKHAGRTIVGSVHVHLDGSAQAADEQSVLRAARRILSAVGVTQLTVQIERQPVPSTVFAAGATSPTGAPIIVWRSHAHEQHGVPHDGHGHSHGGAACDGHGEDRSSECSSAGHGHTHSHGHGHSHGGSATSPACTPSTCSSASGDAAVHSPSHGHSHGGHAHTRGASTVKEDSQPVVSYAHGHSHAHGQCSGGHGHAHS